MNHLKITYYNILKIVSFDTFFSGNYNNFSKNFWIIFLTIDRYIDMQKQIDGQIDRQIQIYMQKVYIASFHGFASVSLKKAAKDLW